jgi:hypothetical protein
MTFVKLYMDMLKVDNIAVLQYRLCKVGKGIDYIYSYCIIYHYLYTYLGR